MGTDINDEAAPVASQVGDGVLNGPGTSIWTLTSHHEFPVRLGALVQHSYLHHPGVVDQDVKAAEDGHGPVNRSADIFFATDVAGHPRWLGLRKL